MTKKEVQDMRKKIDIALAKVSKETGYALSIGNITYDDTGFRTKLTAVDTKVVGPVANAKDAQLASALRSFKIMYDLPDNIEVGHKFAFCGKTFILKGIKPRNRAYPVIADCVTGGSYKLPITVLK